MNITAFPTHYPYIKVGNLTLGNFVYIDLNGNLSLNGSATVYDDLPPTPLNMARAGASAPTFAIFVSGIYQMQFKVGDEVFGSTEVTHAYKEGTNISPHIHWALGGTDTTNRGVNWEFEYSIADKDIVFPTSTTYPNDFTILANTPSFTHRIDSIGSISGNGIKIGSYIIWRLKRIASATTAPSTHPFGIALGFHIEHDTMGSKELYIK